MRAILRGRRYNFDVWREVLGRRRRVALDNLVVDDDDSCTDRCLVEYTTGVFRPPTGWVAATLVVDASGTALVKASVVGARHNTASRIKRKPRELWVSRRLIFFRNRTNCVSLKRTCEGESFCPFHRQTHCLYKIFCLAFEESLSCVKVATG